jgi:hypothetical protein
VSDAFNDGLNSTGNSSDFWNPFNGKELPDVGGIFTSIENSVRDFLTSGGYDPFHVAFTLLIVACVLIFLYYYFVKMTSKSGDLFKYLFLIVGVIGALLFLGVV